MWHPAYKGHSHTAQMKGKKYKRSQHCMQTVYASHFSFHPPYQVLVDASFCVSSLKHKIVPRDQLSVVLGGMAKPMISSCTLEELRKLAAKSRDEEESGAVFVGRRMEQRHCRHSPVQSSEECIKELIGADNPNHYAVASQSDDLKQALRTVAGVPLLFIQRGLLLMERPGRATLGRVRALESAKFAVSKSELKAIEQLAPVEKPADTVRKRRKRGKPNPLSVKKPKRPVSKTRPAANSKPPTETMRKARPRRRTRALDRPEAQQQ